MINNKDIEKLGKLEIEQFKEFVEASNMLENNKQIILAAVNNFVEEQSKQ